MAVYVIRRMRIACRMTKATDTHSEHVILIAFPREQWLRESGAIVRCLFGFPHANVVQGVWIRYVGVMGSDTSEARGPYWGIGALLGAGLEMLLLSHVAWFTVWPRLCSRL